MSSSKSKNACAKYNISNVEWVQDGTSKCPAHSLLASVSKEGLVAGAVRFQTKDGTWRLGTALCSGSVKDAAECSCGKTAISTKPLHSTDDTHSGSVTHAKDCSGPSTHGEPHGVPVIIDPALTCDQGGRTISLDSGYMWCDKLEKCTSPAETCPKLDQKTYEANLQSFQMQAGR